MFSKLARRHSGGCFLPARRSWVALLVVGLLVAGCSGSKAPVQQAGVAPLDQVLSAGVSASPTPAPTVVPQPRPSAWASAPRLREGSKPAPELSARAAVVIDEASGAMLFDKNAREPLPPASLVKIATAATAIESGKLDAVVTSDVDYIWDFDIGDSVMGLLPGDQFTLKDLLYGMLLPSGNDAAAVISRAVGGSEPAFVARMNALAASQGLHDTHFVDAHGLSPENRSSAYDLAMLSRYAMSLPAFREIVGTTEYVAHGSRDIHMNNINGFLFQSVGADGVKTGYTEEAGHTLIGSATRDGHRLYVVILNAPLRDTDSNRLMNWAFDAYVWG